MKIKLSHEEARKLNHSIITIIAWFAGFRATRQPDKDWQLPVEHLSNLADFGTNHMKQFDFKE